MSFREFDREAPREMDMDFDVVGLVDPIGLGESCGVSAEGMVSNVKVGLFRCRLMVYLIAFDRLPCGRAKPLQDLLVLRNQ